MYNSSSKNINTGEACKWFYNSQSAVGEAVFAHHADATAFGGDDVIFHGGGGEMKVCCTHSGDTKQLWQYDVKLIANHWKKSL